MAKGKPQIEEKLWKRRIRKKRERRKCQWGKEQKGVGEVKPLESLIRLHFYVIPK